MCWRYLLSKKNFKNHNFLLKLNKKLKDIIQLIKKTLNYQFNYILRKSYNFFDYILSIMDMKLNQI